VGTSGPEGEFSIEGLIPGRYRLDVNQDGFRPYVGKETYALGEGGSRGDIAVTVTPKDPDFALVMDREALVPGTEMRVGLRSFRMDPIDLTLLSIPTARLLDPVRDFRQLADRTDLTGLSEVKRWLHTPAEGPPYAWREEQVLLPPDLVPGAYLLRARADHLERRTLFFVTDLGLLVMRSPTKALVSAATLKTGQPVPDASIYTVGGGFGRGGFGPEGGARHWPTAVRSAIAQHHLTTDARGMAVVPGDGALPQDRIVAVSAEHGVSVAESPLAPAASQGGDRVYLYTERPIYRPGQTVYWKLFARDSRGSGYVMPAASMASIALLGPDGSSRAVTSTGLSSSGTSDSSFVLPADAPLGDWRVSATVGRATSSATFAVQEYRKPEYKVDVKPDREVYVNGDEIRFVVAANYFFGSPVFGAVVRYNLFESRLDGASIVDEEGYEGGEGPQVGYGRVLATGEARTDVDGRRVGVQSAAYGLRPAREPRGGSRRRLEPRGQRAWEHDHRAGPLHDPGPALDRGRDGGAAHRGRRGHPGSQGEAGRRGRDGASGPGRVEHARAPVRPLHGSTVQRSFGIGSKCRRPLTCVVSFVGVSPYRLSACGGSLWGHG